MQHSKHKTVFLAQKVTGTYEKRALATPYVRRVGRPWERGCQHWKMSNCLPTVKKKGFWQTKWLNKGV